MNYIRLITRRENDIRQFNNVCIAQEEFDNFNDFAEYCHARLDDVLSETRGKKHVTVDPYTNASDNER